MRAAFQQRILATDAKIRHAMLHIDRYIRWFYHQKGKLLILENQHPAILYQSGYIVACFFKKRNSLIRQAAFGERYLSLFHCSAPLLSSKKTACAPSFSACANTLLLSV